ncbi:MAG: prolyl-tRNA synthetase associated domain-containing protein [Candidatus Cryptobacteroides sp.]
MEITAEQRQTARKRVLSFLESNGIEYELYEHPALSSIEECLEYWGRIPDATHCKNLFFRNHKGNRHYLVSMECHKNLDIHSLEHSLRQGKLSFASPERMMRCLGTFPGSVSAFGLISDMNLVSSADGNTELARKVEPSGNMEPAGDVNPKELFDNGHRVKYYIDSDLRDVSRISFHPCDNTASVVISGADFHRFLSLWGGEIEWLDILSL